MQNILFAILILTLVACSANVDQTPCPAPAPAENPEPAPPNLRGLHGDYCTAITDQCTYGWPIPQSQIDAREIVCPQADVIMADPTTIVVCDGQ